MDQSEDDLLSRLSTDLDPSFERLMLTYWHPLYAFVLRRVESQQDAEDIVSEAFVRAYLALKGYPAERVRSLKLRPWLYKITYNEYERAERRQELETLVEALPDRYREAVSLYYLEELSYQQIADLLNQPLGTIKSSVHRGIRLLRKQLSAQSNEVI